MRSVKTAYSHVPCRHSYVEMHKRVYIYIHIYTQSQLCVHIHDIHTQAFNERKHKANIKRESAALGGGIKVPPARAAIPASWSSKACIRQAKFARRVHGR